MAEHPLAEERFINRLRAFEQMAVSQWDNARQQALAEPQLRDRSAYPGPKDEWTLNPPNPDDSVPALREGYWRPLDVDDRLWGLLAARGDPGKIESIADPAEALLIYYIIIAAVHDSMLPGPRITAKALDEWEETTPWFVAQGPWDDCSLIVIETAWMDVRADLKRAVTEGVAGVGDSGQEVEESNITATDEAEAQQTEVATERKEVEHSPDKLPEQAPPGGPRQIKKGISGDEARERLVRLYESGEPYTSQRDFAARLGCSLGLISKVMKAEPRLRGWMARHRNRSARVQSLNRVVTDNTPSRREPDPAAASDEIIEARLAQLLDEADPSERARLNGLSEEKRRELVEQVLEQDREKYVEDEAPKGNKVRGREL